MMNLTWEETEKMLKETAVVDSKFYHQFSNREYHFYVEICYSTAYVNKVNRQSGDIYTMEKSMATNSEAWMYSDNLLMSYSANK